MLQIHSTAFDVVTDKSKQITEYKDKDGEDKGDK